MSSSAYSRWITPRVVPIRFDTRSIWRSHPRIRLRSRMAPETVDGRLVHPQDALDMHHAGELRWSSPPSRLESLVGFANASQALEAQAARGETVEPASSARADEQRIVLPRKFPD